MMENDGEDPPQEPKSNKRKAKSLTAIQMKKKMRQMAKKAHKEEVKSMTNVEEFNADMDFLLKKFKLGPNSQRGISHIVDQLIQVLQAIPSSPKYQLSDLSWLPASSVAFPISLPCEDKGCFQFLPPSSVTVVGSHAIGLANKLTPVDLALHTPKDCWIPSDLINGRYHRKRALYLCYLAQKLRSNPLVVKMVFNYHRGNPLKPVLQILLRWETHNIWVNLFPQMPFNVFKNAKLEASKNNIRPAWFFDGAVPEGVAENQPTPLYNHSILTDLLMSEVAEQLNNILQPLRAADRDGLLLLKHWLLTHGLDQGQGNFGGFLMTIIVASLINTEVLKLPLTKFRVLQAVFEYLSKDEWIEKGVTFGLQVDKSEWGHDVVILDPTNTYNLGAPITMAKARRIQHEAQISLTALKTFHKGFCKNFFSTAAASFYCKFDHAVHVVDPASQKKALDKLAAQATLLDYSGDIPTALGHSLEVLLKRALGERVLVLDRKPINYLWWDVSSPPPKVNELSRLTFGFLLNPELYHQVMDKGPYGDKPEAKEYLQFWGSNKSQLRRLKDGSIREVIIWPGSNFAEKRLVPSHIVSYILDYQAGIAPSNMEYVAAQTESFLDRSVQMPPECPPYGTGEECSLRLLEAFDKLSNMLRNLGEYAQNVTNIHGLTSAFCFTQTFPPLVFDNKTENKATTVMENCLVLKPNAKICPPYEEALEVCFLLKGDEVWQNLKDPEGFRLQKARFYIAVGELLQSKYQLTVQTRITGIDVIVQGYVFRLQLICHKERLLADKQTAARLEKELLHQPRLVSLIQGVHQQYNTLGTAARLGKRWLASQRLLGPSLFPEVCVDLLFCHLYLQPLPFSRPCSPQVAFLRFLNLLSSHDFAAMPIVVDFNQELADEGVLDDVMKELVKHRANLPPLAIATPDTRNGNTWSHPHPTKHILELVVAAARRSYSSLEQSLASDPNSPLINTTFTSPATGDVILHLKPAMVAHRWVSLNRTHSTPLQLKPYNKTPEEKIPVVNYDPPATLFSTLQESYKEFAHFYYDCYGGFEILLEWRPEAFVPVEFSASKAANRKPSEDNSGMLVPDVETILEEIQNMGLSVVNNIEVVRKTPIS